MERTEETAMNGRFFMPMCRRSVNTDISEDFTLPDYLPEIRRVLYIKETLLPPSYFLGGTRLEVSGVAEYTLVYIGSEGKMCSAPLSAEYTSVLPIDNIGDFEVSEGICVLADSVGENLSLRVSAPRRLQLRSCIRTDICAFGTSVCDAAAQGLCDVDTLCTLEAAQQNASIMCESSDVLVLGDEYSLPSPDMRVASADGSVRVDNCRIDGDIVRISGEVTLKLLLLSEDDSTVERVYRKLPLEADCELDGASFSDGALCSAIGTLTELSVNVEEGRAICEATVTLKVCVGQNCDVTYTKDIYSTAQMCECNYETLDVPYVIANKNIGVPQGESVPLDTLGITGNAELIDIFGMASVDGAELAGDKYEIKGKCKYKLVTREDGEYSVHESITPFSAELDGNDEISFSHIHAVCCNTRGRMDSGSLVIDSDIRLSCMLFGSASMRAVRNAEFGQMKPKEDNAWRVCYLSGESLWDVCKKYGVESSRVIGDVEADRFVIIE